MTHWLKKSTAYASLPSTTSGSKKLSTTAKSLLAKNAHILDLRQRCPDLIAGGTPARKLCLRSSMCAERVSEEPSAGPETGEVRPAQRVEARDVPIGGRRHVLGSHGFRHRSQIPPWENGKGCKRHLDTVVLTCLVVPCRPGGEIMQSQGCGEVVGICWVPLRCRSDLQ